MKYSFSKFYKTSKIKFVSDTAGGIKQIIPLMATKNFYSTKTVHLQFKVRKYPVTK